MSKKFLFLISFVLMLSQAYTSYGQDPNLIGWWKFDDGGGTVASDSSGNGYDGTLVGGPTWVAEGSGYDGGGYLDFDGTDDYVDVNYSTDAKFLLPRYTVSLWFRRDAGDNEQNIFSLFRPDSEGNWDNAWHGMAIAVNHNDPGEVRYLHRFPFGPNDVNENVYSTPYTYDTGQWHHAAAVRDSNTIRLLYIDGKEAGSNTKDLGNFNSPLRVFVGALRPGYLRDFNGAIDDVRIYNRPLTQAEILRIITTSPMACMPNPPDGTTGVDITPTLSWLPGLYAANTNGHRVYFGTDEQKVIDRSGCEVNGVSTTDPCYLIPTPPAPLEWSKTYYWAVDEVNEAGPAPNIWRGPVWSFTVYRGPYLYRAAYWDGRYPTAWANGELRSAFASVGYSILDADQLKTWMDARIADGVPSVVVFCQDIPPDTVAESMSSTCTLRRYLDAGGKIVWYAGVPMYHQGHSDGSRTMWGNNGSINILGFDAASGPLDSYNVVTLTDEGISWGLTKTWQSVRPTATSGLRVLAEDGIYAAAWVKHYVPDDIYRGFVRLFDRFGQSNFNNIRRAAEYPAELLVKETSSTESNSVETIVGQKAVLENVTVTGDLNSLNSTFDFNSIEIVKVATGSWANKGFSKAQGQITFEGNTYAGEWRGVVLPDTNANNINLKGSITGEIIATVEGSLTKSVPDSNVYDQYQATWEIGRLGGAITSLIINVTATLTDQNSAEYPATGLHILQTSMEGNLTGDYNSPVSTVINHVRIADGNNPHDGNGFSVISYVSPSGSGQGYTCDQLLSSGVISMKGLFTDPLYGVLSASLYEMTTPRTIYLTLQRVDLGLPPAPDLKVKIWGPKWVSPGQMVNYVIEYRNDGLKAAENIFVAVECNPELEIISFTEGATLGSLRWDIGKVEARARRLLYFTTEIPWGLSWGSNIKVESYISSYPPGLFLSSNIKVESYISSQSLDLLQLPDCEEMEESEPTDEWLLQTYFPLLGECEDTAGCLGENYSKEEEASDLQRTTTKQYPHIVSYKNNCDGTCTIKYWCHKWTCKEKGNCFCECGSCYCSSNAEEGFHSKCYWTGKRHCGDWHTESCTRSTQELEYTFACPTQDCQIPSPDNNSCDSNVATAHDPSIKYGPEGRVLPGQKLDYRVEYENEGEGIAFGVYFTDTLDEDLNDATLEIGPIIDVNTGAEIAPPGIYNPATRTITWLVGEVGPGQGGYTDVNICVKDDANEGTEIINYAMIYFPSVPEETRTNGIVSIVSLNQPPVANAGPDQTAYAWINGKAEVSLNGSDSNDPDGDELSYKWIWVINGDMYEANGVNPTIELPVGEHTIELVVNDGLGDSEPDYVDVDVVAALKVNLCITPRVVNRSDHLRNVTAVMDLPRGIKKTDVKNESFVLYPAGSEEGIEADWQRIYTTWYRRVEAVALFSKSELMSAVPNNGIAGLQVVGQLKSGQYFYGSDTIRIIDRRWWPWWRW